MAAFIHGTHDACSPPVFMPFLPIFASCRLTRRENKPTRQDEEPLIRAL